MPDVVARLQAGAARVADIGCGCGWSSIAIARAFPTARRPRLRQRRGVGGRRPRQRRGVGRRRPGEVHQPPTPPMPTATTTWCAASRRCTTWPTRSRRSARCGGWPADEGAVFVVDERAADALTASDPDPMQRFLYAASVLHCLPVGRSEEGSAATGTVHAHRAHSSATPPSRRVHAPSRCSRSTTRCSASTACGSRHLVTLRLNGRSGHPRSRYRERG